MGKKTKKEKIIADLRRQLIQNNQSKISLSSLNSEEKITEKKEEPKQELNINFTASTQISPPSQTQSLYIYPVQLIRKDLTKTLLLCILAISLELALYFLLEKGLALPF